jgi:hypothetical protein
MCTVAHSNSVDLRTTGTAEIPRRGDHPAVLLSLLFTATQGGFPRDIDFRMLTRIAVLVDNYQFHEVVEMFTNT